MRVKVSSYRSAGNGGDYLLEVSIDGALLAYASIKGRKYVALGRNTSALRRLFESSGSDIVVIRKYVYEVVD
jgi:ribosomal protein L24E